MCDWDVHLGSGSFLTSQPLPSAGQASRRAPVLVAFQAANLKSRKKEVKIKQYVAKRDLIVGRLMVMSGNHFILSVNCFLEVAFCEGFPFPVSQAPSN